MILAAPCQFEQIDALLPVCVSLALFVTVAVCVQIWVARVAVGVAFPGRSSFVVVSIGTSVFFPSLRPFHSTPSVVVVVFPWRSSFVVVFIGLSFGRGVHGLAA